MALASSLHVPTTFAAIDKFSPKILTMQSNVNRFATKSQVAVARMQRSFRMLESPISRVNKALSGLGVVFGAYAAFSVVRNAVNIVKDFEQATSNLSSVVNPSDEDLVKLTEHALLLGATTQKTATEVLGLSTEIAKLGFKTEDILPMAGPIISGAIAMNAELASVAKLTGAIINTFDDFSAGDSSKIMNILVGATQNTALDFQKLAESLPIVGASANTLGIPLEKLISLLGILSNTGLQNSILARNVRQLFGVSATEGQDFEFTLDNLKKIEGKFASLAAAIKLVGRPHAVGVGLLSSNEESLKTLNLLLMELEDDTAFKAMQKQQDNLGGSITLLGSAYDGFIITLEKSNGAATVHLRYLVDLSTAVLSLASGIDAGTLKLSEADKALRNVANIVLKTIKVLGIMIGTYLALKLVLGLATVAMSIFDIAVSAVTSSLVIFNLTIPIGWIILLIGLIALVVYKWDEWGDAILNSIFPMKQIQFWIETVEKAWILVSNAFQHGGINEVLRLMGASLVDLILDPLYLILKLLSYVPGAMGVGFAGTDLVIRDFIKRYRDSLLENDINKGLFVVNPKNNNPFGANKPNQVGNPSYIQNLSDGLKPTNVFENAQFYDSNISSTPLAPLVNVEKTKHENLQTSISEEVINKNVEISFVGDKNDYEVITNDGTLLNNVPESTF